jgi:hypothetical protein
MGTMNEFSPPCRRRLTARTMKYRNTFCRPPLAGAYRSTLSRYSFSGSSCPAACSDSSSYGGFPITASNARRSAGRRLVKNTSGKSTSQCRNARSRLTSSARSI